MSRLLAVFAALVLGWFVASACDDAENMAEVTPVPGTSTVGATTGPSPSSTSMTGDRSRSTPAPTSPSADATPRPFGPPEMQTYDVPSGSRPHDVAPAEDGGVWYTAQGSGELGHLDPATGDVREIALGAGSEPHGVIVGPDGAPWITDGGLNAIVRVEPETDEVTVYPLPDDRPGANLNTATFDLEGRIWFTGQSGIYGVLDPETEEMQVFDAPRGRGPYGITTTPDGDVYYASLAGSYVGRIDPETGEATVLEPPTAQQGARRVWSDSQGRIWVSEWNAGQVSMYDPASEEWQEWDLPSDAQTYSVYVDDRDGIWLTDFAADAIVHFDPVVPTFTTFELSGDPSNVRQMLGRPGEVWGAESAVDRLVVIRY